MPAQHHSHPESRWPAPQLALAVALVLCGAFGVLVLASGDWLPGTVIVVAALVGLAQQIRTMRHPRP